MAWQRGSTMEPAAFFVKGINAMRTFSLSCRKIAVLLFAGLIVFSIGGSSPLVTAQPASTAEAVATGPTFSPWALETVRSVNTDPRLGIVIVVGPEEGQENAFACSGGTLLRGKFDGEWNWTAADNAWMCQPDAPSLAGPSVMEDVGLWPEGRSINTDPAQGMSIISGPMGSDVVAICDGSFLNISSPTYEGGEMETAAIMGTQYCGPSGNTAL